MNDIIEDAKAAGFAIRDGKTLLVYYKQDKWIDVTEELTKFAQLRDARKGEALYMGLTREHTWISINREQYEKLSYDKRAIFYTSPPTTQAKLDKAIAALKQARSDWLEQIDYAAVPSPHELESIAKIEATLKELACLI